MCRALIRRVNSGSERSRINRCRGGGTIATWLDSNASVSSGEGLYFSVIKGGFRKKTLASKRVSFHGTVQRKSARRKPVTAVLVSAIA